MRDLTKTLHRTNGKQFSWLKNLGDFSCPETVKGQNIESLLTLVKVRTHTTLPAADVSDAVIKMASVYSKSIREAATAKSLGARKRKNTFLSPPLTLPILSAKKSEERLGFLRHSLRWELRGAWCMEDISKSKELSEGEGSRLGKEAIKRGGREVHWPRRCP